MAARKPELSVVRPTDSDTPYVEPDHSDELDHIKAQLDALKKRMRELTKKSPARKVLSLVEVEARQSNLSMYLLDTFASFANARVKTGAEPEYAVQGVLAMYQQPVLQALTEHLETGEPIASVTARMLGRTRGHRQPKED